MTFLDMDLGSGYSAFDALKCWQQKFCYLRARWEMRDFAKFLKRLILVRGITSKRNQQVGLAGGNLRAKKQKIEDFGAARGIRTPDPLITNQVLYQLSYSGAVGRLFRVVRRACQADAGGYLQ